MLRENFGDEAEERQKEMKAAMNKVLFEQRDDWSDMRTEGWKRDAKREKARNARQQPTQSENESGAAACCRRRAWRRPIEEADSKVDVM